MHQKEQPTGFDGKITAFPLDNPMEFHYNYQAIGVWRSLVSRMVRVHEAAGSNPATPTKNPVTTFVVAGFLIVAGFEDLNAMRVSIAADGSTEANLYFRQKRK